MKFKNKIAMKTTFQFKNLLFVVLFAFVCTPLFSQNYETTKTVNKWENIDANGTIDITNRSGDFIITTSTSNKVILLTSIKVTGKSQEDVDKVVSAIENFDFKKTGNRLTINTRFYKSMNSINNRSTIVLLSGGKARVRDFKISHELQIPETCNLVINNKYSDIELQDTKGRAEFNLYSSKLHSQNILNNVVVEAKYSKLYMKEISGDIRLDIYDTDIEFISAQNLSVESKYSKIKAERVGELTVDSYDDKFTIDNIKSLKLDAKYSDLESRAELDELTLELYDCNIEIESAKSGSFSGKYSELKLGDVKQMNIGNSYDNDLYFNKTMDISVEESKYSKYEFGEIAKFTLAGYDDNIEIDKLNSEFSGISVSGKYGKIDIYAGSVPYQLYFKLKYPKIDIPESVELVKHIEKSNELELVGNKTGGKISVEGYDMKVVVK